MFNQIEKLQNDAFKNDPYSIEEKDKNIMLTNGSMCLPNFILLTVLNIKI